MTKILFLGSHLRSGECLQYLTDNVPAAEVVGVVLNRSDSGDYDQAAIKLLANKHEIPLLSLESVSTLPYDLGISIMFDRKLPAAIVDQPPKGLINLHLGPLPRLRGVNSVYHAIRLARSDDNWMFGITLHYIDYGLDTGAIIDKLDIPIGADDTAYDLYVRATGKIPELFVRNIGRLVASKTRVPATPQVGPSSYFGRSDFNLEVDLSASADEVYDTIRALTFPGKRKPFSYIGGRKIFLSLDDTPDSAHR